MSGTQDNRILDLEGAAVLITGAAKGIGAATAAAFAARGAVVYPTDVDVERGRAAAAEYGAAERFKVLDVRDEQAWEKVVDEMEAEGHPLQVMVNSAGAAIRAPLADTSLEGFRRMVDLNLVGTFLGVRTAARRMVDGGAVVNISSLRGVVATAELGAYGASKFGVRALTRVAAIELAHRGIRVNDVCPGSIDTEITAVPDFDHVDVAKYVRTIPMQRRGAPEEVAEVIVFLAEPRSSYITGVDLLVDGGTGAGVTTPTKNNPEENTEN
ncbi:MULTISPECIES: SDR family NAD(P)-dependent oxidoreductase [Gordonia]|uniref:Oxidoreductase n=2 Tax=Gordonia paraffinivorans TaxID=175628 RepID=A0ABQ0IMP2_9ACTN|nr:SDR family oxidoreductase [Gordonia paraffinivorans]MCD2147057.1 SDR family oxidoreductase [Gordonia paraffinivorans]GAC84838.1 putative oxidoreductase [Gordonia paraffinivorans NBRC 108238]VFA89247.1 3-alpha-(or 20-beta)-hydroxysteroid dehydrogenase [Gordonia paraffinivorans]